MNKKTFWGTFGTGIMVLAAIVQILKSCNPNSNNKVVINNSSESVTSQNQQGGITANTVNIIPSSENYQRRFNEKVDAIELNKRLPENKYETIGVSYNLGNAEAEQFAREIEEYLKSQGWKTEFCGVVYDHPVKNVEIWRDQYGTFYINVGNKP